MVDFPADKSPVRRFVVSCARLNSRGSTSFTAGPGKFKLNNEAALRANDKPDLIQTWVVSAHKPLARMFAKLFRRGDCRVHGAGFTCF